MEDGEIDLFNGNTPSMSFTAPGFSYYNILESCDSSQDSRRNHRNFQLPFDKLERNEESKKPCFQVSISDIGSVDSRSTVKGRPRSSSQPTENNEKMFKEPFVTPQKKDDKRIETMSNCSNMKMKPAYSVDGCSVDGGKEKSSKEKRRFGKSKKERLREKYPNLLKQGKRSKKRHGGKKKPFKIHNIDEVVKELNSISSPVLYCDLLYKILREKNKTLLRNVIDEIGMADCTQLLREVALIQENGKITCFSSLTALGGMKVQDGGNRMKTLGGVFFYLIRKNTNLDKEVKDRIFKPEKKYLKAKKNIAKDLEKLMLM